MTIAKVIALEYNIDDDEILPFDMIRVILSRLPVRTLGRFTSVCKLWHSLIRSPNFINAHLDNHTDPSDYCILLVPKTLPRQHSYKLIDNDLNINLGTFDVPVIYSKFDLSSVGNSCSGILCLTNNKTFYGRMIYLYNPSIKKLKLISHDSCIYNLYDRPQIQTRLGFGYCKSSRDFNVVRIHYVAHETKKPFNFQSSKVEIYSLNAGSWRQITAETKGLLADLDSVFCNGFIYWRAINTDLGNFINECVILSFDISSREFNVIEMPSDIANCRPLLSYNGLLAVLNLDFETNVPGLWVMEKCGNSCSWSKVYNCEAMAQKKVKVIGFASNGKLLMSMKYNKNIVFWDPKKDLMIFDYSYRVFDPDDVDASFVETLILYE